MKYQCVFSILDMINVAKDNTGDEMNPKMQKKLNRNHWIEN